MAAERGTIACHAACPACNGLDVHYDRDAQVSTCRGCGGKFGGAIISQEAVAFVEEVHELLAKVVGKTITPDEQERLCEIMIALDPYVAQIALRRRSPA